MKKQMNIFKASAMAAIFSLMALSAGAQENFVTGLDEGFTFCAASCGTAGKTATFTTAGKTFKIITFYYDGSTVTALEDASGKRNVIFMKGKPNMPTASGNNYPQIGFCEGKELETNVYMVGPHDFTDDGQPELVIALKNASEDGMAIYVFGYNGSWKCMGEMMVYGHNVRSSRVFRQTVTIKDADSGILYTWTWHDGKFDFLSSDKRNDPGVLY